MSTTECYLNTLNDDKKISLHEYLISSKIKLKVDKAFRKVLSKMYLKSKSLNPSKLIL